MLVMGKGMAPVVPPELQQYMHYITTDPAAQLMQMPPSEPPRPFQITHANPPQRESDFLSQMQNHLHPSDQPQINFLRPPKLQLYTPVCVYIYMCSLDIYTCFMLIDSSMFSVNC